MSTMGSSVGRASGMCSYALLRCERTGTGCVTPIALWTSHGSSPPPTSTRLILTPHRRSENRASGPPPSRVGVEDIRMRARRVRVNETRLGSCSASGYDKCATSGSDGGEQWIARVVSDVQWRYVRILSM